MKTFTTLLAFLPAFVYSQSPGGVSTNLALWNKASAGVTASGSDVATWADQTGSNLFSVTGTGSPQLLSSFVNYNPGIRLNGSHHFSGNTTINNITHVFSVGFIENSTGVSGSGALMGIVGDNNKYFFHTEGNPRKLRCSDGTATINAGGLSSNSIFYNILTEDLGKTSTADKIRVDGSAITNNEGDPAPFNGTPTLGSRGTENLKNTSVLMEQIVYTTSLSSTDESKVETYLAIKYGRTLAHDYLSAAGATVYAASTYGSNIIGIARDDNSALLQKQSHSGSDTTRIYLATLQGTTAANTGTFASDGSFVITGNNAGQMFSTGSTEYPTGQGIYSRLDREWKLTNTNFSGTFSMDFKPKYTNVTAGDLRILIDDDGDFSNAVVYNPTITFNSGVITVSDINNTMIPSGSTRYLTLVSLNANTPLPVSLTAFTARPKGAVVELNWTTATEQKNAWFVIERSANGMEWQQIGKVPGAGNSSQSLNYSYTDAQPLEGTAYYRLKQTDVDGTYEYSPIKEVRMQAETVLRIYPNPVSNEVALEGNQANIQSLKVFDALGKEVTHQLRITHRTQTKTVINMAAMRNGLYIFRINDQAYKVMKK